METGRRPHNERDLRIGVRLTDDKLNELRAIANIRFGGNMSTAALTGVELVRIIYGDLSTFAATDPSEALLLYIESQKNRRT